MNTDEVRARFESWFTIADGVHYSVEGDEYITTSQNKRYTEAQNTQYAWEGYQQATKENKCLLKEAIVFADEELRPMDDYDSQVIDGFVSLMLDYKALKEADR